MIVELNKTDSIPLFIPVEIEVTDLETGITTGYPSASVVAKALSINRKLIVNYFYSLEPKPVLGKYTLKKVNQSTLEEDGKVTKLQKNVQHSAIKVEVKNIETSETLYFSSLAEVARNLGCSISSVLNFINNNSTKPLKGKYLLKRQGSEFVILSKNKATDKFEVTNIETHETNFYPSLASAGRAITVDPSYLSKYLKKDKNSIKPIRQKYIIKK